MAYIGALLASAMLCLLTAAAAIAFVALRGRREPRQYGLLIASIAAAPLGPVLAAAAIFTHQPIRTVALSAVAGSLVACGLMTATLLRRPRRMRNGGAWRDLLDGLLLGDGIFSWCWTLLLMNNYGLIQFGAWRSTVGVAVALVFLVCAIVFISLVRIHPARGRIAAVSASATLTALSAGLVAIGSIEGWSTWWMAASMSLVVLACALLGWAALLPWPVERPDQSWPLAPFGAFPSFAAVASICTSAIIQAWRIQVLDLGIAVIGIPIAILLGLRISLALREARRSAMELIEREAQYWRMANVDPLTSLSNRRRLRQALEDKASLKHGPRASTLLIFDLDGFKDINDLNGHDVGDAVLVEVGERLRATIRPGDLAVRLGGDEFAAFVDMGPTETRLMADDLLAALCRPYEVDGGTVHLSASIGLAPCTTAEEPKAMMRNADLALRLAKQAGKRRIEEFDVTYDRSLQRRLAIEHDLRGSGKRCELTLLYQPVIALPSERLVGVEALLRWRHPTLGLISPNEFVPIAEETGLIGELGAWVTNHACQQLGRWREDGHHLWMAVNVSPRELRAPSYLHQIGQALARHGIPPEQFVLELTESAVAQDSADLARTLRALRATGLRIALDDFGAGYSSLGQLRRLEVDILKIDRELVAEPPRAPALAGAPLVDVIVSLGQRLGLDVIAEGVEIPSQRAVVEAAGCTLCQGYLFAEPMAPQDIESLLAGQPVARLLTGA